MAPLPKRRHSTRRGGKRKAAIRQRLPTLSTCPNCGAMRVPHRVCKNCGYYDAREVIKQQTKGKSK